jgi:hypothetical protein
VLRDPDLPEALYEMEGGVAPAYAASQELREQRLEALGQVIAAKRDAAVTARKESGIEAIWTAAEEAYLGIDEANRAEFSGSRWAKPTSVAGPLTREKEQKPGNKSTVFVPLTARYVDMAFAKVSEIVLPIDDKAFSLKPTPMPDLGGQGAQAPQDPSAQPSIDSDGNAAAAAAAAPAAPAGAAGQPAPPQPAPQLTPTAQAAQLMAQAAARAKKEEDWIYDNWVESNYPREMRKVLFDSARIGTGVLKGPVPTERKAQAFSVEGGVAKLAIEIKIRPGLSWADVWNLFPAPGCGEDIHDGDHLFDRDYFSPGKLKALKTLKDQFGAPLYLAPMIDKVLEEGPGKVNTNAEATEQRKRDHKSHFEVWTFYGTLTRQDMVDMGAAGAEDLPDDVVEVFAIVTLVNDTVIRATVNPLESGRFPFYVLPWQRRSGYWAGVGVGERVDVPQKMVNGATRAMLNNAGKSAGSQIVIDRRAIRPADNSWDLNTGDKLWELTGEPLVDDVRKIFMTYQVPNLTPQLLTIIDYALKLAEQTTNLPLVAQGQAGPDDPETFGQAELQNSNANVLLRSIAWSVDDNVTEPLVEAYHEWYMLDPEVADTDKGDLEINARGSMAMVERAIQEATYAQLLQVTANPVWGQDPKKVFAQFLKTKRLNPEDTAYSEADLQRIQNTPPPPPPQVQAAQVNAAAKLHAIDMQGQQRLQEIQAETAHEQAALTAGGTTPHEAMAMARIEEARIRAQSAEYTEDSRASAEAARAQKELEIANADGWYKLKLAEMQRDILLLEYAQKQNLTLMQVKGQLANTALQVRAKHDLQGADQQFQASENMLDRSVDLHKHHTGLAADAQQAQQTADAAPPTAPTGATE